MALSRLRSSRCCVGTLLLVAGQATAAVTPGPGPGVVEPADPPGVTMALWRGQLVVTAPDEGRPDLARLTQRLTLAWEDITLADAAEDLRNQTGINLLVMPEVAERPLTLKVRNLPLGEVLAWMERLSGAVLGARSGAAYFSAERLPARPATRIYEVSDLLVGGQPGLADPNQASQAERDQAFLTTLRQVVRARTAER